MTAHLWVYGIIGTQPKNDPEKYYSFSDFRRELDPKATDYTVHIMSPGGDVYQGAAMYNALVNTGKKIKVLVEGVCASIATLVAGAASPGQLFINEQSQWMVHNPKFMNISGDANELRTGADQLDQIKTLLINVYRKRTGLSVEALWKILSAQTWMLPEKAKELGFVDEVVESMKAVAFADVKFLTEMEDKSAIIQAIENLGNRIAGFFRPKNMTDTLADGTVIQVESEDGDWTGKKVYKEDGSPLPPGDYTLASGRTFSVAEDGTIATVTDPEAKTEEKPEDMDKKTLDDALARATAAEERVKELESALAVQTSAATQAQNKVVNLENKINVDVKALADQLNAIKNTTVGDAKPPKMAETKVTPRTVAADPMQAFFKQNILDVRNTD